MKIPETGLAGAALLESERYCLRTTRHHAKSFYFASWPLPRDKKVAAYSIYAFCRYVDDLIDEAPGRSGAEVVGQVQREFERFAAGQVTAPAFASAFAHTVQTYRIPAAPFLELTRGVLMDAGPVLIETWPQLQAYCHSVASVVGLMMCPVFGLQDSRGETHAAELGTAMQLTNILRDIKEDFRRGRVYLPAEELARFGVSIENLESGQVTPAFRRLMEFQISRARAFYARAEAGIPMLADGASQLTVWIMRHVYGGILAEIEKRHFDVFGARASTRIPRKLQLTVRAYRDYRRFRNRGGGGLC
ncbi:MAG TPA: phytoene/squalene synthase family protein [Chthoniobacterales bacterium]